jgi:hypothetical protein
MLPLMGGPLMKQAVQRAIWGTNSAFALGSMESTDNLDRDGR